MRITFHAPGLPSLQQVDDRPILQETGDGVVLIAPTRRGEYRVELTMDDCQRIAESIAEPIAEDAA